MIKNSKWFIKFCQSINSRNQFSISPLKYQFLQFRIFPVFHPIATFPALPAVPSENPHSPVSLQRGFKTNLSRFPIFYGQLFSTMLSRDISGIERERERHVLSILLTGMMLHPFVHVSIS